MITILAISELSTTAFIVPAFLYANHQHIRDDVWRSQSAEVNIFGCKCVRVWIIHDSLCLCVSASPETFQLHFIISNSITYNTNIIVLGSVVQWCYWCQSTAWHIVISSIRHQEAAAPNDNWINETVTFKMITIANPTSLYIYVWNAMKTSPVWDWLSVEYWIQTESWFSFHNARKSQTCHFHVQSQW